MSTLRFTITDEILDRIVYGMENQVEKLLLNPHNGMLVSEETNDDTTLIPMPTWRPVDGFRLMDMFVGSLPPSNFSRILRNALGSKSGVFRRFKDILAERPEMNNHWRRFKQREMRKTAIAWLNRWSDALVLENLHPAATEDWEDITAMDFIVRKASEDDINILANWQVSSAAEISRENSVVAVTPAGELVGFSSIYLETRNNLPVLNIRCPYVLPDYRGLGIGKLLADQCVSDAITLGAVELIICIPDTGRLLHPWLERNGFQQEIVTWKKKLTPAEKS